MPQRHWQPCQETTWQSPVRDCEAQAAKTAITKRKFLCRFKGMPGAAKRAAFTKWGFLMQADRINEAHTATDNTILSLAVVLNERNGLPLIGRSQDTSPATLGSAR
jgi:hypothetical protein